ncbi:MAG: replication factor C large subunit [Methanoculleaceae archaeon]
MNGDNDISGAGDWAEKYRPRHLNEIVDNRPAVKRLYEWAKTWSPESPPLILYGKPGTGKTSSAYALASDCGWDVVELNASDERTAGAIGRVAGAGSLSRSLSGAGRRLILLDEADNIHGSADRGGGRAIVEIIRRSRQPIILIANDLYGMPGGLRSLCETVQFRAIQVRSIVPRLREICVAEGITFDNSALRLVAEQSNGDLRAAINTLQAISIGKDSITVRDVVSSSKSERKTVFDLIAALYRGLSAEELLQILYAVDESPDTIIQWIEANTSPLRDFQALEKGYRALARADEYLGWTFRRQYYTLWRYANALMLLGISDAAGGTGIRQRIRPPSRWKRMGKSKKQRITRQSLFGRLSSHINIPVLSLQQVYLPLLTQLVKEDPVSAAREWNLEEEELNIFLHDRKKASSIVRQVAKEAVRKEVRVKKGRREERKQHKSNSVQKTPPSGQSTLF